MTTARKINSMIDEAAKQGQNVYGYNLIINPIGLLSKKDYAIRVVRAETRDGEVRVRKTDGTWCRISPFSTFDTR